MENNHVKNLEGFLDWIKTCPYEYTISTMQGGFIHTKIAVPYERIVDKVKKDNVNKQEIK